MNTSEIQRKARIGYLNLRIVILRFAMSCEEGPSEHWKAMARRQGRFIQERNHLMTPAEIRKIEKRRGLL
ncbi:MULTISPECIES: hypothetical protein [unclassified Marinobacter]|uniref:hypothetical protein n=1 Tax=unclassified Marinobacter TaxID=83889 RepID=UPI0019288A1D|nr:MULTISPECIES: hypothetical protein [unclassified Marinobacter]MBL3825131.1 hypothetical protein [Marinobacter sp. MC3]MBL3893665.1 hypothetical protein [Marinobacter sp. MW3]